MKMSMPVVLLFALLGSAALFGRGGAAAGPQGMQPKQAERLPNAKQHFQRVKDALLSRYYDSQISEDDLYRAALQGMLAYLDPKMSDWNHLLSPSETTQLHLELAGEMVGVGVVIKFDEPSGNAEVLGLLPGSAAEKAGVKEGDRILTVNGKAYQGKTLLDMVQDIRGKAGETVELSILRGAQVLRMSLRRERVVYDTVSQMLLPGKLGYLSIRAFNANTDKGVRAALEALRAQGAVGLIIDLRGNQGGAFDQAVSTAGLLLRKGQPIVQLVKRGGKSELRTAPGDPVLSGVPVAVLVNGKSASGTEFLTAALREDLAAVVVGEKTLGKWSVQTIQDLEGGYAVKFTTAHFRTPSGQSYEGQGLVPDVTVNMDDKQLDQAERVHDPAVRLLKDVQLRTAARLLTR